MGVGELLVGYQARLIAGFLCVSVSLGGRLVLLCGVNLDMVRSRVRST